ncbi:MAG: ABC transporter ATP-binding protein [Bacillota bacterium]|nr:ABC transporter ATP-binding protein [Bacillota bacterium]
MEILSVDNVYKAYGKHQVLKGVSFEIERPGIRALIGPNGSGKTTLFSVIVNLLRCDAGTVKIDGLPNTDPEIFRRLSFLKDNTVLYDYMTGMDHLQFIAHAQNLPKKRIDEVCDRLGIRSYVGKRTGSYSLGMKQHLLLAMAIMNQPRLMLLDEPLNGLDPTSVILTRRLLKELADEGTSILLSSHTLAEIDFMTSDILFLSKGQIIEEDISVYRVAQYRFVLAEDSIHKAHEIFDGAENVYFDGSDIVFESDEIQRVIDEMRRYDIQFREIKRRQIGAEERYRAIFHDEIAAKEAQFA